MEFPLQLVFKFFALAPQVYVRDAKGAEVFYVKQKLFKLKEDIHIFADQTQGRQVAAIKADRIIDFNARYTIASAAGQVIGAVGRRGMRSLWAAHYQVFNPDGSLAGNIREENPLVKILDALISEIPIVGILSNFLFHPHYLLSAADGKPLLRLKKKAAFLEGKFELEQLTATNEEETTRNVLAFLMLVLLERARG